MSRILRKFAFCAKSEPKQKQTSDVECAVCQDEPTVPCTVPCGNHHVFCLACLQGLVTHNHYTTHFPCPLCRTRVRIPLGGVAAFKQGKGRGRKFLARLPMIRPRCRRSSLDSLSSGWPDYISNSDVMVVEVLGFDSDSDDTDDLSSMGVPSEGGESIRELNLEGWHDTSDAQVESQAAILEEIRQNRERNSTQEQSDQVSLDEVVMNSLQRRVSGESENASEARDREGRPLFRVTGDDNSSSEDIADIVPPGIPARIPGCEELDMAVVLQLIADMENFDSQEDTHHATTLTAEDTETEQCQAENSPRSAHCECSETTEESGKTREDSPHSDRTGQHSLPANTDWKCRTIKETAIPRPKLTLHCDTSGDARSFRQQHEDEHLEVDCPGLHHQEADADLTPPPGEELDSAPQFQQPKMQLLQKAKFDQQRTQMSTDQNRSSELEPSSADQEGWNTEKLLLMNKVVANTETLSTDHQREKSSSPATSKNSEELGMDCFTWNHTDSSSNGSAGETRQLPEAERTSDHLTPEEWRLYEIQKLRVTHLRRTASLADTNMSLDTEVIISEDPDEWIRRIRSLQRRRRGQGPKRPITRSQSHGGKPATSGSVGEKETGMQRKDMHYEVVEGGDKDSEGRGEDMRNAVNNVDGETKCENKASNITVIHV